MIGSLLIFLFAAGKGNDDSKSCDQYLLWEKYCEGDNEALAKLFLCYMERLIASVKGLLGHGERAYTEKDVINAVILDFLRKEKGKRLDLKKVDNPLLYLKKSCRWKAGEFRKKNNRHELWDFLSVLEIKFTTTMSSENLISLIEHILTIPRPLLTRMETKILRLYLQGMKIKDIANELNISPSSTSQQKFTGLQKLKEFRDDIDDLFP